jgi:SAM-dependent methyltransferase
VPPKFLQRLQSAFRRWWTEQARQKGFWGATSLLARELWEFVRDSSPARRRQRYGDMEYDWEFRVNTTSGTVGWRERLLGHFHSAYQPTDPIAFRGMMNMLPISAEEFTFIDLGSGKGRTLLLASEYPFQRIIGVELLPELHRAAEENIRAYGEANHPASEIESVLMDACDFDFPPTPLVVYLFHPLPMAGLERVIRNLDESLVQSPRDVWVVYHNPVFEKTVAASKQMGLFMRAEHLAVFRART